MDQEREELLRQVDLNLRLAIPRLPIGKYTRITSVQLSVIDRNHTLKFVIHGACPVIFGIIALDVVVDEWNRLGLYNSTLPACTVINNGAPKPPPTSPPPPSIPPARVRVDTFVSIALDTSGLSLTATAAFADVALNWAIERAAYAAQVTSGNADGATLTRLTVVEDSTSTLALTVDDETQLEGLLPPLQDAGDAAMCDFPEVTSCDVSAVLPSPPAQPPPLKPPPLFPPLPPVPPARPPPPMLPAANGTRRLQQVAPQPPANSSMRYLHMVNLHVERSFTASVDDFNATTGLERLNTAIAAQSAVRCPASAVSCPTRSLRSSSVAASALTELRADISLTVIARSLRQSVVRGVAGGMFLTVLDTSDLSRRLAEALGANASITVADLYAQYMHPRYGLVVIRGNLPPPPPRPDPALAATVGAVTTAVTTVVAAAVGAAVAGALAGAAGSAAVSTSASSGTAQGGVAPLIFGVQRFSASSGLAANQSELQTGLAGGLGWAAGSLGLVSRPPAPPSDVRRRLQACRDNNGLSTVCQVTNATNHNNQTGVATGSSFLGDLVEDYFGENVPETLIALLDNLLTFFAALLFIAALQLFGLFFWKKGANRAYYEQREKEPAKIGTPEAVKFKPLPGIFIFPNMLTLCFSIFLTGLVGKSVALILDDTTTCTVGQCRWPGIVILILISLFMLTGFVQLFHFWWFYSKSWKWRKPEDISEVHDPLYMLVTKVRLRCVPVRIRGQSFVVLDRLRGEFAKADADIAEPQRTERLLAKPVRVFHSFPADAIDGMKLLWLSRASGSYGIFGAFYVWSLLLVQLFIAVLSGVGPSLEQGSLEATVQVYTMLSLQWAVVLYALLGGPSADRIDNIVITVQYTVEGTSTLLLILQDKVPVGYQPVFQTLVFYLLLLAMGIPILSKGYEVVVVNLYKCLTNMQEMTMEERCFAIVNFLTMLPVMIGGFFGFECEDSMQDIIDSGVESVQTLREDAAAVGAAADNILFNLRQRYAARKLQAGAKARFRARERAAIFLQAWARGSIVRIRRRWLDAGIMERVANTIRNTFKSKKNLKLEAVALKRTKIKLNRSRIKRRNLNDLLRLCEEAGAGTLFRDEWKRLEASMPSKTERKCLCAQLKLDMNQWLDANFAAREAEEKLEAAKKMVEATRAAKAERARVAKAGKARRWGWFRKKESSRSSSFLSDDGLLEGWAATKAPDGRVYYFHAASKKTTWMRPAPDPVDALPLPPGWMQAKAPDGRTYYYIQGEGGKMFCSQWDRPGAAASSPAFCPPLVPGYLYPAGYHEAGSSRRTPGETRSTYSHIRLSSSAHSATDVDAKVSAAFTDRPGFRWLEDNVRMHDKDTSIDATDDVLRFTSDEMHAFPRKTVSSARAVRCRNTSPLACTSLPASMPPMLTTTDPSALASPSSPVALPTGRLPQSSTADEVENPSPTRI